MLNVHAGRRFSTPGLCFLFLATHFNLSISVFLALSVKK